MTIELIGIIYAIFKLTILFIIFLKNIETITIETMLVNNAGNKYDKFLNINNLFMLI